MAYNPIAPTSSRENRKPPTNVPQGGVLVDDPTTTGRAIFADSGEAEYVMDTIGGRVIPADATADPQSIVILGGRSVVI